MNNNFHSTSDQIHSSLAVDLIRPSNRIPAWGQLGMSFASDPTAEEAFRSAGLAYQISEQPLYVQSGDGFIPVKGHKALQHSGTGRIIDVVSQRYETVDNMDLARYLEPIRQWGKISHAGTLGDGDALFVVFRGPEFEIAVKDRSVGDVLQFNAVAYEDKRSGNALRIDIVPIRFVCVNGMVIPVFADAIFAPIAHNVGINQLTAWTGNALGALGRLEATVSSKFQTLADVTIDDQQVQAVFESAWPLPKRSAKQDRLSELLKNAAQENDKSAQAMLEKSDHEFELATTQALLNRATASGAYHGEVADQGIAGTAWGAYNAVTATIDHKSQGKKVARSAIFGDGADVKVRAFKAALSFSQN